MEKNIKLLKKFLKAYNSYWDTDKAIQYTPLLFSYLEPEQIVIDSLKALDCKNNKEHKYYDSVNEPLRLSKNELNYHFMLREIKEFLEELDRENKVNLTESKIKEYKEFLLNLFPILNSEEKKNNFSVNIDPEKSYKMIYEECQQCSINEICKGAFSTVNNYVASALKKIDIDSIKIDDNEEY